MPEQPASNLTRSQISEIATMAADRAVERTLLSLGVDIREPIEAQKDFAALREWRESAALVKRWTVRAALTVFVGGVVSAIWIGFKHKIGMGS